MDGTLLRVCGIGVLCAVSGLLLHRKNGEFSSLIRVAGSLLIVGGVWMGLRELPEALSAAMREGALGEYASLMLKALGVATVCATCGDVCRECGAPSVASGVELAGNFAILGLCLPLLQELIHDAFVLLEWG